MVERSQQRPLGRGRPAIRYRAGAEVAALHGTRAFVSLVDALTAHLTRTSRDPVADAIAIGRSCADQFGPQSDR
ncbi:hypothetical protein CGZ95_18605 [Enemella evansiae]|uniref:hypothetical protein n=1 Tax=Enemella evansiae TaxID=2016499 RepID=UPI000B95F601|nr:hypothetical protein [Enemella evansiae]OYN93375.1 hypothetical protein CGZ95_18605 [Enemella evansiae]